MTGVDDYEVQGDRFKLTSFVFYRKDRKKPAMESEKNDDDKQVGTESEINADKEVTLESVKELMMERDEIDRRIAKEEEILRIVSFSPLLSSLWSNSFLKERYSASTKI